MFTQMGDDAKRNLFLEESYNLNLHFPCTDNTVLPGQIVTLLSTGLVARITAATQRPLGYVVSNYKGNDAGNIRVATPFQACAENQNAAAAINPGTLLAVTGVTAGNVTTYAAAVSTNYATAVALSASTGANTPITVGILRVPHLVA